VAELGSGSARARAAQRSRSQQGQYAQAYLKTKLANRPTRNDLHGFAPPADDAGLIDHEAIPLFSSEIFTPPA
jgi:hypothetical protein